MKLTYVWHFTLGWINCYCVGVVVTGHWYPWS